LNQAYEEEANQKRQLWKFQELLSQVSEWNVDKVQREIQKIITDIQCDYLEELVTAVFIAHTKVLTAIRIGNKNKRVQITIPKLDHFLHRSLSECSRLLWSSAYLFHNDLSPIEKQKNHRQIEGLLHEGVGQAIRGLLPVKNILKDYLSEPDADEKDEDDEKVDAVEVVEKAEKIDEVEKVEKAEEVDEVEKAEKVDEVVEKTEKLEKVDIVENAEKLEKVDEVPLITKLETPVPPQQTLIIDTEPSVRFTNFDQVIKENGTTTSIDYVENTNPDSDEIAFVDDSNEELSDFEDLTQIPVEPLSMNDYETL
jgi:hypothetical protein